MAMLYKYVRVILFSLLLTQDFFIFSQNIEADQTNSLPTRWFFNTTRKEALDLSYGMLNFNENQPNNQLHSNIQFWSVGLQYLYRGKTKFFADEFFRYSRFLSTRKEELSGSTSIYKGYQITGASGLDLIGWKFFDITPLYGYSFGSRKVISEFEFERVKYKNPYFALLLGVDSRFNIFFGGETGISLGGYAYYLVDVTRSTWKTKGENAILPENGKMNGLQLGLSLQYIFGLSDGND